MATKITDVSRVPSKSPGINFREVDLTVVSSSVGGFSAAAVGLMEKGPAFEISNSASYEDRAFKMGEINPKFPTSYYAKQYLEQAKNYKEVRVLGLEGYKDTHAYAITLAGTGSVAADFSSLTNPTPLIVGPSALMCILKERPDSGRTVVSVEVQETIYTDPTNGMQVSRATDYLFGIKIAYEQPLVGTIPDDFIIASLRPDSIDYIIHKLGTDPLDLPKIKGEVAPLWVDFIVPSLPSRPNMDLPSTYYLPGTTIPQNSLDLTIGETAFGTTFTFQSATIMSIVPTLTETTVTVGGTITPWLTDGDVIEISDVIGTGNIVAVNGLWTVVNVQEVSGNTTFELLSYESGDPLTIILSTSVLSLLNPSKVAKYMIPTWEKEVLDFENIIFQTPITPWVVSDGDLNGDFKKLFRFWSISDGKSANTEVKMEFMNMNPAGNNGKGTFDIHIRKFSDRDDMTKVVLERFTNLTMDRFHDNYILRKIGNGEDFPIRSRFVFIEMNEEETLPLNSLPWGVLGYPNVTGKKIQDIPWTLDYDKAKPSQKQTLGMANNKINMNRAMAADMLSFKNIIGINGKGFHLNPNNNAAFVSEQAGTFVFANQTIYKDNTGRDVTAMEKTRRSRFVIGFYGGFDGFNIYSTRTWGDSTSKDYEAFSLALEQLRDKESLDSDFTILTTPDMNFQDHAAACEYVLDMVRERGDCLYLPDLAYDKDADPQVAVDAVIDSQMRSNNVAFYFPWIQIEDQINKINKWLPPSLLALGTITHVSTNENVWQPPGGALRTVTNNLVRTRRRLKLDDREVLFGANINPITLFAGSGYEIAGVRTGQEDFSALSFIHNKLLLYYAKKVLNQTLRPLLFQLSGDLTKDAFIATVRPIFDRIKKLNGVEDFDVQIVERPELNDRTTIYGRIVIVPLYPIERIIIDFVVADNVVNFNN